MITLHQRERLLACLLQYSPVAEDVGYFELWETSLPGAEEVAGATDLEVGLCYHETIRTLRHHFQTLGAVP